MPHSNIQQIPTVVHFATAVHPKRIYDVGLGNGTYGFLMRQYLDIGEERIKPETWQLTIDAIDIFKDYHNPIWDYFYNTVTIGDVRQEIKKIGQYDVILFNDVLEHVTLDEAHALLADAFKHASTVIATTPNQDHPQGAWGGNEAETHLCLLKKEDFPHLITTVASGGTTCYVCSNDPVAAAALREIAPDCPVCTVQKLSGKRIARKVRKLVGKRQ